MSVQNGFTALIVAAQEGHLKIIVEMLIASKANINHQNDVSCLWFATVCGCV